MRTSTAIVLSLLGVLGASCREVITYRPNLDHCTYNGGDEFCAANYPDAPLCNAGEGMCVIDGDLIGCHAEVAPECHAPCGEPGDFECVGGSSSGTESGSGTEGSSGETAETDGSSSSDGGMTTTGDMPCMGDDDCTDAAAPFCDPAGECVDCGQLADGNAACAEADPGRPVCDAGVCVACTEQDPGACGGQTPVCGEDNLCQACTEHSECPGSACHLDGPMVGACFDLAEVMPVGSAGALAAAAAGLSDGESLVVQLVAGDYNQTVNLAAGAELAIIGPPAAELTGTAGLPSLNVAGSAIVYVGGVSIASGDDGVSCSGTSVWLDDSEVRNNAQTGLDISGGCAAHLRRSVVRANVGGGIILNGASLAATNSAISTNLGPNPAIQVFNSSIDVTYSTLVGNFASGATPDSVQCLNAAGSVRNSIVRGEAANSVSGCNGGGLVWEFNSVDTAGLGASNSNDGAWMSSWFAGPDMGDYHLTTSGETEFADIASWQEGDPLTDIDGDPIPTAMPSFPGYDQP